MRSYLLLLSSMLLALSTTASAAVTGTASLADAVAAHVSPGDTVFIFARASSGPRMPLALLRTQVGKLPFSFSLDDTQAMMPQMRLSGFGTVDIVARVSKSGNAMPVSGDLEGSVQGVGNDAEGLILVIDRVLP